MVNYIEHFQRIAEEISTYDFLTLVDFKVYPPASDGIFKTIEEKTGVSINMPIRNFYKQTNGLKLRWRIKPDLSKEEWKKLQETYDDYTIIPDVYPTVLPENRRSAFANIDLLPIEDSLVNEDWEEVIIPLEGEVFDFQNISYPHDEFARKLKPFDLISDSCCMSFVLEEGATDLKVMLLGDYYIEWDNSRITNFESYIEMLIATRGIVESRHTMYGEYRGDLKPPLITGPDYWTEENIPKMFRKREK